MHNPQSYSFTMISLYVHVYFHQIFCHSLTCIYILEVEQLSVGEANKVKIRFICHKRLVEFNISGAKSVLVEIRVM